MVRWSSSATHSCLPMCVMVVVLLVSCYNYFETESAKVDPVRNPVDKLCVDLSCVCNYSCVVVTQYQN